MLGARAACERTILNVLRGYLSKPGLDAHKSAIERSDAPCDCSGPTGPKLHMWVRASRPLKVIIAGPRPLLSLMCIFWGGGARFAAA